MVVIGLYSLLNCRQEIENCIGPYILGPRQGRMVSFGDVGIQLLCFLSPYTLVALFNILPQCLL